MVVSRCIKPLDFTLLVFVLGLILMIASLNGIWRMNWKSEETDRYLNEDQPYFKRKPSTAKSGKKFPCDFFEHFNCETNACENLKLREPPGKKEHENIH